MDFHTVLDISSIIWDEDDFKANSSNYYELANSISVLFDKLEKEKPKILLRNELLDEMISGFPFSLSMLPNDFWAFGHRVYSFLGNIGSEIISYPGEVLQNVISIPYLIKEHYNETTKQEANFLISKIHTDKDTDKVYFTFKYLWVENDTKLVTTNKDDERFEYETIVSDKDDDLNKFFEKFKPIFEHNPKHDKTPYNTKEMWENAEDKDGFVSRLSCYNGIDKIRPQEVLDCRYRNKIGDYYYGYDDENDVYVIFRHTRLNLYHGYDENNPERIPHEVRKHFNK